MNTGTGSKTTSGTIIKGKFTMTSFLETSESKGGNGNLFRISTDDPWSRLYRRHIRESAILRASPNYNIQYGLGRFFQKRMHPFRLIQNGQTCVQVGCTEWMLDFGVSQPLIMAGLVGKTGQVYAIDPDARNEAALAGYLLRHKVSHVFFHKDALFDKVKEAEFTFYEDRTSSNCITEVADVSVWQDSHKNRPTYTKKITLNTLDNVCAEKGIIPNFVNISINDAEFGVIQGMTNILSKRQTSVAWLIGGGRAWWAESIKYFLEMGFDVVVGNAPYSRRGPSKNGKVNFLSADEVYQEFYAVATPKELRNAHKSEVRIAEMKIKENSLDFVVTLAS